MTVQQAVAAATKRIMGENAKRDAETLLLHTLGRERAWLLANPNTALPSDQMAALEEMTRRRAAGVPLQYITGEQEFLGLSFRVTPDVLIPRPETEHLVEAVLAWAAEQQGPVRILDIGTGSGAIALALAANLPDAQLYATDISAAALLVACENAGRLGLADRVRFAEGDLLGPFDACAAFDAIVSNPPYVPSGDAAGMQREVIEHEPHSALFAGEDGLAVYRRLVPAARAVLREDGLLAMEIGYGQREALQQILQEWQDVRFLEDYAGIPRVALSFRR